MPVTLFKVTSSIHSIIVFIPYKKRRQLSIFQKQNALSDNKDNKVLSNSNLAYITNVNLPVREDKKKRKKGTKKMVETYLGQVMKLPDKSLDLNLILHLKSLFQLFLCPLTLKLAYI